ncbi:MAG: hypothetical protein KBE23_14515 [Chloroflexi bacterium]|nr:hypothetical protein [Chloroflexota bacterium]
MAGLLTAVGKGGLADMVVGTAVAVAVGVSVGGTAVSVSVAVAVAGGVYVGGGVSEG